MVVPKLILQPVLSLVRLKRWREGEGVWGKLRQLRCEPVQPISADLSRLKRV